jgi:hypothetical protein
VYDLDATRLQGFSSDQLFRALFPQAVTMPESTEAKDFMEDRRV